MTQTLLTRRSLLIGLPAMITAGPVFAQNTTTYGQGVGIILVGASWCVFCKSAAPVLAAMTENTGIPVLVASQDARPIPPFPTVVDAREHPIASTINTLPTTLVYSQGRNEIVGQVVGYRNARHYAQSVAHAVNSVKGGV